MRRHASLGIVTVTVLLLFAAVVYLAVSLAGVRSELDETTATLQTTAQDLARQEATNASLQQTNSTLRTDNANLEGYLDDALTRNGDLVSMSVGLQSSLTPLGDQHNRLDAAHTTLSAKHDELTSDHDARGVQHDDLKLDYGDLADRHADLTTQYADLEEMVGTMAELEERIAALETELKPLVLGVNSRRRNSFLCTGSMEPAITCLDGATWVTPADPADIVVGTTISFDPDCTEGQVNWRSTAHRVTAIKVVNGVTYYWPKGDANEFADGCWVPYSDVHGYIVELHKGAHPENAFLRDQVNASRVALDEAEAVANEAEELMDTAGGDYDALLAELCGEGVGLDSCQLSTAGYVLAIAAYGRFQAAVEQYRAASDVYNAAYDRWDCWYLSAQRSEGPGHIPHECASNET